MTMWKEKMPQRKREGRREYDRVTTLGCKLPGGPCPTEILSRLSVGDLKRLKMMWLILSSSKLEGMP